MDAVTLYLGFLTLAVWISCGLIAYHSFLGDMYSILRDAAGSDDGAREHFDHWKRSRNIRFVYAYFVLTGPFSLLILIIATHGFRTGFRR